MINIDETLNTQSRKLESIEKKLRDMQVVEDSQYASHRSAERLLVAAERLMDAVNTIHTVQGDR